MLKGYRRRKRLFRRFMPVSILLITVLFCQIKLRASSVAWYNNNTRYILALQFPSYKSQADIPKYPTPPMLSNFETPWYVNIWTWEKAHHLTW